MTKKATSLPTHTQETEIAAELGVSLAQSVNGPLANSVGAGAGAPLLNILTPQDKHEKPPARTSRKRKS